MALTIHRWAAIPVLGCAIIALASLPARRYEETRYWVEPSAAARVRWRVRDVGAAVAVLERRDNLLSASRFIQPTGLRINFDTMVPLAARPELTKTLGSVLAALPSTADGVRVLVFVSRETRVPIGNELSDYASLTSYWYFLPVATDGRTCLALSYPDSHGFQSLVEQGDEPAREHWAEQVIGPCAWYRAFGLAGPGVEQWLRNAGYLYALGLNGGRPRARLGEYDVRLYESKIGGLLSLLFGQSSEFLLPTEFRACAHDDLDVCRYLVHVRDPREFRQPFGRTSSVAIRPEWSRNEFEWFLADLHQEIGDDRFRSFWSSRAPVDSAFRTAVGSSMEQWASRWLRSRIERPQFGPAPSPGALALGAALVGLLLGVASLVAARRQVA